MTTDSTLFKEYSKKINQLRLSVIDDIAHAEFLKSISESDSRHVIKESEVEIEKISCEEIKKYEATFRIKIPDFIKFIMTEIGQSNLVDVYFFRDGKITKPIFYFSYDFFHTCLKAGLSSDYLNEFDFDAMYENDTNTFKDSQIQKIYEGLNCDDNTYIVKLLPTGHGDCSGSECVILNGVHSGLVVWTVGWYEKVHVIDGVKYSQYDYRSSEVQIEDYCMASLQRKLDNTLNIKGLMSKQKIDWSFLKKIFDKWF